MRRWRSSSGPLYRDKVMTSIDPKAALAIAQQSAGASPADALADRMRRAAERGDDESLKKAAAQFESYFVHTMLKDMRRTTQVNGTENSNKGMETWNSMFDQEVADRISQGRGLGLSAMILEGLKKYRGASGSGDSQPTDGSYAPRGTWSPVGGARGRNSAWSWPLPKSEPGRISSDYGARHDPIHGHESHHGGMDIAAPQGTPVLAMADGVVVRAGLSGAYGNLVELRHSSGAVTRYAHQDRLDVRAGDSVQAGQQLGTVGSTGRSTGHHLHLEVRVEGHSVDPMDFLRKAAE